MYTWRLPWGIVTTKGFTNFTPKLKKKLSKSIKTTKLLFKKNSDLHQDNEVLCTAALNTLDLENFPIPYQFPVCDYAKAQLELLVAQLWVEIPDLINNKAGSHAWLRLTPSSVFMAWGQYKGCLHWNSQG